ncbi:putative glycerol-3-phosphate acyltransferase 3 [Drosera capensis]
MASYAKLIEALRVFFSIIVYHKQPLSTLRYLQKRLSSSQKKFKSHSSLVSRPEEETSDLTVVFNVEETLLKSSSLFPFFMLVAFEAGTPLRALVLLALYPLICVMGKERGLKVMVMVAFCGIKKESFYKIGRSVMCKFFLEEVGLEGFEVLRKFKRKVGFSHMPRVMVESFLKDYMEVDHVVGSEIKEFRGYFTGLFENNKGSADDLGNIAGDGDTSPAVIGLCGSRKSLQNQVFSACKEIHVITGAERRNWTTLPKDKYLKPLIFHDSRLVSKPTPSLAIAVLMWLPFAFLLFIVRTLCFVFLPPKVARLILCYSGCRVMFSEAKTASSTHETTSENKKPRGLLYVCNHRTLSDPVYLKMALDKNVTALTYSLSKMSEEIHVITGAERRNWTTLPKDKYLKPLIFHDSRLVSKPTPSLAIAVLMWLPFAFLLFIVRTLCFVFLPPKVARLILCYSGCRVMFSEAKTASSTHETTSQNKKPRGLLYVCNHRTLSDPVYLKMALDKNVTALTYSLSKMSEIISPIRTVRLTRQREQDAATMEKLLSEGNVAVCAEGTTCREPYLLRFSPLFVEMSDVIVPVAMDTSFTLFYGNTAGGYKCLDPVFFLMDPHPSYTIKLLEKVKGLATCQDREASSKFDLANHVQAEIGNALGFECTTLTRKDKYLILAGNDGSVTRK